MAVIDVLPFFNELDLLDLRLRTLSPFVDQFVISEARYTFSGRPKPLYLTDHISRFPEFAPKIVINVVEAPPLKSPFETDRLQKNLIKDRLAEICHAKDIVIFSDADEIPNPVQLPVAFKAAESHRIAHMAQDLFYYYLNLKEISGTLLSAAGEFPGVVDRKWIGTRVFRWGDMGALELDDLRQSNLLPSGVRVPSGGWHFSFVGSEGGLTPEERVRRKIKAYAHQEYNNARTLWRVRGRVRKRTDILSRDSAAFKVVPIDNSFPEPLQNEPERYQDLILPGELE